jgi:hypothetical protein
MYVKKVKGCILKKWCFCFIAIMLVSVLVIGCGSDNNAPTSKDNAEVQNNEAVEESEETKENEETPEEKQAVEEKTPKIEFSDLLVKSQAGMTMIYGEAINNDSKAHSFTLKVTFYDGDNKIIGTASGAVNNLNGGDTKIFAAMTTDDISNTANQKVQVDTLLSAEESKPSIFSFSEPFIKAEGGMTLVDAEVTNNDSTQHSFSVTIGFYDTDNKLIGVASGAVNGIGSGETKTFSCMASDDLSNATSHKFFVDTVVE